MTDPTISLGGKRTAVAASIEARVAAIERAVQQIPSRYPNQPPSLSRIVTQTAHGFVFQDVVARGASTWAKANASGTYEPIGLVLGVLDVNTFVVALRGCFYAPGLVERGTASGVTDWTRYSLSDTVAGDFKADASYALPSGGTATRGVFMTLDGGWIEVLGPEIDAHDHLLENSRNVLRPGGGYSLGQVLAYDPNTFGTGVGGWKAQTVVGTLGSRTALSVLGNATNASATVTDIAAAAAAFTVLNCNGTVLQWTQIGTAYIGDAAITAVKLGSDVTFEVLKDVNISSPATYDYARYNAGTSKWIKNNLGPITTATASGGDLELFVDGGAASGQAITVGIGHSGSRFFLGNAGATALDFKMSGSSDLNTDVCLRMKTSSAGVKYYDQSTGLADGSSAGALAGTQVMEWGGSATAANRYFRFLIDAQFDDGTASGNYLTLHGAATNSWVFKDSGGLTYFTLNGTGATASLTPNIELGSNANLVLDQTNELIIGTGVFAGTVGASVAILWNSTKLDFDVAGFGAGMSLGTVTGNLAWGVFGSIASQRTLAAASALVTAETAGGTYTSNEQTMLGHLKTDVTNIKTNLDAIRTLLRAYGISA